MDYCMKQLLKFIRLDIHYPVLLLGLLCALIGCQNNNTQSQSLSQSASLQLIGLAFEQKPLSNANITLIDSNGKQLHTTADSSGRYQFPLQGLSAPLLLSAVAEGDIKDCTSNSTLRPICMA